MNARLLLNKALVLLALVAITGCGLATSEEERIARAEKQISSGAYRAAMIELKNVLAGNSEHVRARLLLAEVSLGLGDLDSAEKEMARAAEYGAPEKSIGLLNLRILAAKNDHTAVLAALGMNTIELSEAEQFKFRGQALLGLKNFAAADANYRDWLAMDPASVDATVGLAKSIAAAGNVDDAIFRLESVVAENPQHVDALHALGILYSRIGDYQNSEKYLADSLDSSKPQTDIRRHVIINGALVEAQLALGKTESARNSLSRLSSIMPQSPLALFLSARLAYMEQDLTLAARQLQTLLNVSPDNRKAQLFLANVQMQQGNFAQAEALLTRIVALAPDNIQARKMLAQVQVRRAEPQGAVEALAPLLEQPVIDADVYNLLAQISLQKGDDESVVRNLRAASAAAPDDLEAKLNLVAAYLAIGDFELATQVLATVPDSGGDNFRRHQLHLSILRARGQSTDADQYASALLTEHKDDSEIAVIVSNHYVSVGNVAKARSSLSNFTARYPDDSGALLALGQIEISEGNVDTASPLFATVLAADPDNLLAMLGLARAAELSGDEDETISLLETAATKHSDALAPRVWLASRFLNAGRLKEAEAMASELVSIGFRSPTVNEIVGQVFLQVGRIDEAIAQFESAVMLNPDSPRVQLNIARGYLAADRTVEARGSLEKALQQQPDWTSAKILLALVELRQGKPAAALRLVDQMRRANPDDVSIMVLEAEIYYYQADYRNAAAAFNRAVANGAGRRSMLREFAAQVNGKMADPEDVLVRWLDSNSNDTIARTTLAQYYLFIRDGDKAVREYETVLVTHPDNAPVLNNLAWQYQQLGNLDKALEAANKAFTIDGESGAIADTLGWIYRDLGQMDKSRELLSDATRMAPDNGEIRFHFAAVLAETGDKQEARRLLEELIERDARFPSRRLAEELLGRL